MYSRYELAENVDNAAVSLPGLINALSPCFLDVAPLFASSIVFQSLSRLTMFCTMLVRICARV